jgi:hypothetical protein
MVCSTFSRSGWSVVRSASLAKVGTATKFQLKVKRWVHELLKRLCNLPISGNLFIMNYLNYIIGFACQIKLYLLVWMLYLSHVAYSSKSPHQFRYFSRYKNQDYRITPHTHFIDKLQRSSGTCKDQGSKVLFPAGAGNFSLHHRVQNGSGDHPASYPMGNGGSFPGSKTAEAWSWPLTSI